MEAPRVDARSASIWQITSASVFSACRIPSRYDRASPRGPWRWSTDTRFGRQSIGQLAGPIGRLIVHDENPEMLDIQQRRYNQRKVLTFVVRRQDYQRMHHVVVTLTVAAWWAPRMPVHVRATVVLYSAFFLFIGQPFNTYWGELIAPLVALWLAYIPEGLSTVWAYAQLPLSSPRLTLTGTERIPLTSGLDT